MEFAVSCGVDGTVLRRSASVRRFKQLGRDMGRDKKARKIMICYDTFMCSPHDAGTDVPSLQ